MALIYCMFGGLCLCQPLSQCFRLSSYDWDFGNLMSQHHCVPTIFCRLNVVENVGRFSDDFLALIFEAI